MSQGESVPGAPSIGNANQGVILPPELPYIYTNAEAAAYALQWAARPTKTLAGYIDAMFTTLKSDGTYGLLDWLHLVASPAAQSAVLDIKGNYNGTINGSPVFTANAGYSGAGATANFIKTAYDLTAATSATKGGALNNESMFVWTNDTNDTSGYLIGSGSPGANSYLERTSSTVVHSRQFSTASTNFTTATPNSGLIVSTRGSASTASFYHNGTTGETVNNTGTTSAAPSASGYPLCYCADGNSGGNSSTSQIAVTGAGQNLAASNVATLYSALHTFLVAIGAAS